MKKENKVFYPRLAGIGDFMPALAMMTNHFKGEAFTIVAGAINNSIRVNSPHYVDFYKELASALTCCKGIEFLGHTSHEENISYLNKIKSDESINWLVLDDKEETSHGYKYWGENVYEIMQSFSKYFEPSCSEDVKSLIRKDKINVCFQLRKATQKGDEKVAWHSSVFTRNVDLDKWAKFIAWIAKNDDVNLIAIGESNPESAWFIQLDEIPELVDQKNIHLAPWDYATSLTEDMYIIKHCDLFLGAHSGPQQMAWLLAKPAICFDYKRRDQAVVHGVEKHHCPVFQKICWGIQSLDEMKELWGDYYQKVFKKYRGLDILEILKKKYEIFDNNFQEMLQCLKPKIPETVYNELVNKRLKFEQIPKTYEAFYLVSFQSYRLASFCIKNNFFDLALKFLDEVWGYSDLDVNGALELIDKLKLNGYSEFALSFLRKYIFYYNSLLDSEGFARVNNYLIKEYIAKERFSEIKNYCMNVFGVLPEYLPTVKLIEQIKEL